MNIEDYKIYMFEGCDRVGKSTFIKYFFNELKRKNYNPFTLHLMGPTKFEDLSFNNDDKSLIQLAKFNDEYDILREMLMSKENDQKMRCILDRTSFGEYIWTKYWNRTGKYTDYVTSEKFIQRHLDMMQESVYIYLHMSDLDELERRIGESEEDKKIFTIGGKTIKENILYVYQLYDELKEIISNADIPIIEIDTSKLTFEGTEKIAKELLK